MVCGATVSFESPLLLLALLLVPALLAVFLLAERRRMRYAVRFTNLDLLAAVVGHRTSFRRYVALALFLLALTTLCVALARPHVRTLVADERAAVILVSDTSRSMGAVDVRPTRLAAAQVAARAFIARVPKRLRLALVAFAGDVQVAAVPTRDHDLVLQSLNSIGTISNFGGTAIGDALARAVEVGKEAVDDRNALASADPTPAADPRGLVSILFVSDGRQNRGILPPLAGAARAKAAGIPVYTVALGTARGGGVRGGFGGPAPGGGFGGGASGGSPLQFRTRAPDPETLRAIARVTGGRFFAARTAASLRSAYASLGSKLGRKPDRVEVTHLFLLGAAAVLGVAGAASVRLSPRFP
jgi:Ca-activated chloride channel family protein